MRGDWGPQRYPIVPGHEIAGVVTATGPDVTRFTAGDHVGVGCMVNSCGQCASCRNGDEQYCQVGTVFTYGSPDRDGTVTQGGYSTHIVADARFVLSIPDRIGLAAAAPLLCAGITTYNPLRRWGVGPGTVSVNLDMDAFLSLLAVDGTIVSVGAAPEPVTFNGMLLGARRTVTGSMIGGITLTQEMLDFCGEHGLGADVEVIPASQVNQAYERVLASDVRYRFVIDIATLN